MGTIVDRQKQSTRTETAEILTAEIARRRGVAVLSLYFAFDRSRRQGLSVEPDGSVLTDLCRICRADTLDECEGSTVVVEHTHRSIMTIRDPEGRIEHRF